jgi:hypothetical protein
MSSYSTSAMGHGYVFLRAQNRLTTNCYRYPKGGNDGKQPDTLSA